MRALNLIVVVAPLFWFPAQKAGAQTLAGVFPGDRIRVRAISSGRITQEGEFHEICSDALILPTDGTSRA